METKYYRDEIDLKISMGEVALICYEKILDKDIMSRIITSTILELHLKKYIKFDKDTNGKIIIQIKDSKKELKKTEKLVLELLKESDEEEDNKLNLDEITGLKNERFLKNKENLKNLIIEEAIEDEYIDKKKLELKQKYFNNYKVKIMLIILIFLLLILRFSFMTTIRNHNHFDDKHNHRRH